nr:hypothetical protein [Rhodospirillales bacterium]
MARTFTIYCCGTGSNSFDFSQHNNWDYWNGELVSTLAQNHAGMEFVDWIILDGPGSGISQQKGLWAQSYSSGLGSTVSQTLGAALGRQWEENADAAVAYVKCVPKWFGKGANVTDGVVTSVDPLKDGWFSSETGPIVDSLMKLMESHNNAMEATNPVDDMVGHKISDLTFFNKTRQKAAINRALGEKRWRVTPQMLQQKKMEIFAKGKGPITTVNLIGWSRGAVTTHMIANRLNTELSGINVNIFACDPVPGMGQFEYHRCHLNSNVQHYIGLFAKDEMSVGFTPVCPPTHRSTIRTILPVCGRHGTLVGNANVHGVSSDKKDGDAIRKRFKEVGEITRDMAEKFLTSWGTPLNNKLNLSNPQILEKYEKILDDKEPYNEMKEHQYTARQRGGTGSGIGDTWRAQQRHVMISDTQEVSYHSVPGLEQLGPFVNAHHLAVALAESNFNMNLGMRGPAPKTFQALDDAMQMVPHTVG